MHDAMNRLPKGHKNHDIFEKEVANVRDGAGRGALELFNKVKPGTLIGVHHVAQDYKDAKAADLLLMYKDGTSLRISVKTDKSGKVAIADGQTPDIDEKVAKRYFQVSAPQLEEMNRELGIPSMIKLKSNYLNVAKLVAHILIRKLGLVNCRPTDFSQARVTNLEAAKYLFRQLLHFKQGSDGSQVIIIDRTTGGVKWESLLDGVNIDRLTTDRISFRPSQPRGDNPIASEFGIKIDGKVVVTFQIKHKRGAARETDRRNMFSDITIRLMI
jgi:hypothetical protein